MKKIFTPKVLVIAAFAVLVMAAGTAVRNANTPPTSMTGAPSESDCSSCHGAVNSVPSNLANLKLTFPFSGGGWVPDSTYTLTLTYTQSGITRYGFQVTALTKSTNNPAGTLTAGTGSTKGTATVSGKTREYISQSSSTSGTWVFTWKAPSTAADSVIFYVAVNASNGNGTNDGGDQIYLKQFNTGPSALLPQASITASNDTICAGDTIQFTGNGTNSPTAYNWKFRGTPATSTSQNPKIVYNNAGLFIDTLRVTNAKGVSVPAVITIRVNTKPTATINTISPNDTICQGDTVTLISNAAGAGGKYAWNTGNPNDNAQTLKVTQSGSYRVTITNSSGCSNTSAPANIVVNPKPTVTLGASSDSVCSGSSILYTATPTGAASYMFMRNGTVVQNTSANTYTHTFNAADSISVIAVNGCQSAASIKIPKFFAKLGAPTVTCGTPTTSSVIFNWTAVTGTTGYEVSIDSGKTWIAPSSGSTGLTHTVGGLGFNKTIQLRVRGITTAPCNFSATGTGTCTTLSCSGITYNVLIGDTLICSGDSTSISIKNISATKFSIKFNNGSYKKDSVYWVKPTVKTQYDFELIDSTNLVCPPATFTASVNVDNPGALAMQILPGTAICAGTPLIISSTNANFVSYELQVNGTTVQTKTTPSFTLTNTVNNDNLQLRGTNANSCKVVSTASAITVNPLPKPGFTATINKKVVDFDDTTSTSTSRVWNFGDASPLGSTKNPSHTYATVGTFNVTLLVQDSKQCRDSVTKQITTNNISVGEIEGLKGLEVYPNPTNGKITVAFNWAGTEDILMKITDIAGKTVWSEAITTAGAQSHIIDMETLPAGVYMLRLQTSEGETTLKVLKQGK